MSNYTDRQIVAAASRVISIGRYLAATKGITVEESKGYESAMSKLMAELGVEWYVNTPPEGAETNP